MAEYLQTSYSPDCEYGAGFLLERNAGQGKHSYAQGQIIRRVGDLVEGRGLLVLPEQRTRVSAHRIRIPDVSVVASLEEITTKPPLLCVEVMSPDDRWSRIQASLSDYQAMGVPCTWVVDPYRRRAWTFEGEQPPAEIPPGGLVRADVLDIEVTLADVLPPSED